MALAVGLLPFISSGGDFAKHLEKRFAGFRIKPPTQFPWAREAHVIELAGVCWHVGKP